MPRELTSSVVTIVEGGFIEPVLLAKFDLDEPAYFHTGLGTITYDGNDYVGVGNLAGIGNARESELVGPRPFTVSLSGLDFNAVSKAKDSASYGDVVTIYYGYRQSDGTVYSDPIVWTKGKIERVDISQGEESTISVTIDHDVNVLNEKDGSRFTDEDQQDTYSGDEFFKFLHDMPTKVLQWGGRSTPPLGRQPGERPVGPRRGDRGFDV